MRRNGPREPDDQRPARPAVPARPGDHAAGPDGVPGVRRRAGARVRRPGGLRVRPPGAQCGGGERRRARTARSGHRARQRLQHPQHLRPAGGGRPDRRSHGAADAHPHGPRRPRHRDPAAQLAGQGRGLALARGARGVGPGRAGPHQAGRPGRAAGSGRRRGRRALGGRARAGARRRPAPADDRHHRRPGGRPAVAARGRARRRSRGHPDRTGAGRRHPTAVRRPVHDAVVGGDGAGRRQPGRAAGRPRAGRPRRPAAQRRRRRVRRSGQPVVLHAVRSGLAVDRATAAAAGHRPGDGHAARAGPPPGAR